MNTVGIGKTIRELRKKKGITQEALAGALSVSPQAVSKWESGLTYPDMTMIPVIAGYFDISLDTLFDYDTEKTKQKIQKIMDDAWIYFFSDPTRYAQTMKDAVKDYPGNEALLTALLNSYEYDLRESGNTAHLDDMIELAQILISESTDFTRVCEAKEIQAAAYLKKGRYQKAKEILESLPDNITLKNDTIAFRLSGKDKLNGAIRARCAHLEGLYIACMEEGDAWFHMCEHKVVFRDYTEKDYIPAALSAYQKGLAALETFLIGKDGCREGQEIYLWDGMQTFRWSFYLCIAACQKKLGETDKCCAAMAEAYRVISTSWRDFEEKFDHYIAFYNQCCKEYDLEEFVR